MISNWALSRGRRRLSTVACLASVAVLTAACSADGDGGGGGGGDAPEFPTDDIRAVIPFGAGGGTDADARAVLDPLDQLVDVSVVPENIAGGGGTLGLIEAMTAPADGHTLALVFPSIHAFGQVVQDAPYDLNEMQYVGGFREQWNVIGVAASSGIETFDQLLERGQEQGRLIVVSGPASNYLVTAKGVADAAEAEFDSLGYEGVPQACAGLEAGDGDFWMGGEAAALGFGGGINILAVAAPGRIDTMPDVPTLEELGHDVYLDPISAGFAVAPDTDPAIVDQLEGLLEEAVASDAVQEYIERTDAAITWIPADDFRASVEESVAAAEENEDVLAG
ncbi:tripartite tricarboxylate transporter substrate binding protein [Geodermatophilus sp. CPCC 206100]|uniref:tripartite tricarboxylate transporter substrate binding protein n=1 Tax=Geodermatophilus sp. CPCC 206100 TaxID=3020054 RepID=UPI003B00811E